MKGITEHNEKQEHKASCEERNHKGDDLKKSSFDNSKRTSAAMKHHLPKVMGSKVWMVKSKTIEKKNDIAECGLMKTLKVNKICQEKNEFMGVKELELAVGTCLMEGVKETNEDEKTMVLVAENEEVKHEIVAVVEFGEIIGTCGSLLVGKDHRGENENDSAELIEKVVAKTKVVKNVKDKEVIFQFLHSVDVFESLDEVVGQKNLKEEDKKDVAPCNEDEICEWEMKLWRLVDEKEVRRSKYEKKKESKHRDIRKNMRHNYKMEMDMNEALDENNNTQ